MSCGRINILSRIKWLIGYSFSRTKRPYETGKCHDCLWCEYIQQCMEDYKCLVEPEITGDWYEEVYGETPEMIEYHKKCTEEYLDELEREGDFR